MEFIFQDSMKINSIEHNLFEREIFFIFFNVTFDQFKVSSLNKSKHLFKKQNLTDPKQRELNSNVVLRITNPSNNFKSF